MDARESSPRFAWFAEYDKIHVYRHEHDPDATGPGFNVFRNGNGLEFSATVEAVINHGKLELFYYRDGFDPTSLPDQVV